MPTVVADVLVALPNLKTMLKSKNFRRLSFQAEMPSDEIYEHLNIWVGNGGFATPENIENAVVGFKVEKSWVEDKNIDQSSVALERIFLLKSSAWELIKPDRLNSHCFYQTGRDI